MLIPTNIYSENWTVLGQRQANTKITLIKNNGIVHSITLFWNINEKSSRKSWFSMSERVSAMESAKLNSNTDITQSKSIPISDAIGKKIETLCFHGRQEISKEMTELLLRAGVIDEINDKEGMQFLKEHVTSVESVIKRQTKKVKDDILSWVEQDSRIGIQRRPFHPSLLKSTIPLEDCVILPR